MKPHILAALKDSIEAWEKKAKEDIPKKISLDASGCQLCIACKPNGGTVDCSLCPVFAKTGCASCDGTPWREAAGALRKWILWPTDENLKLNFREKAQVMTDFLRGLLPNGESA